MYPDRERMQFVSRLTITQTITQWYQIWHRSNHSVSYVRLLVVCLCPDLVPLSSATTVGMCRHSFAMEATGLRSITNPRETSCCDCHRSRMSRQAQRLSCHCRRNSTICAGRSDQRGPNTLTCHGDFPNGSAARKVNKFCQSFANQLVVSTSESWHPSQALHA